MSFKGITFGSTPIRGVNAGGWLVLEPWITPSMFSTKPDWVIDERTYGRYWRQTNYTQGFGEIQGHWGSWMRWQDFRDMVGVGLNVVRIPIGFWSIIPLGGDEPFMTGAFSYLQQAVGWCRDLGLGVVLDLHGVPGGQNGFDNSGETNSLNWFSNSTDLSRTLFALSILAQEFTSPRYASAVLAIELVNEPFPQNDDHLRVLEQFYRDGYGRVREVDGGVVVMLGEAFSGLGRWEGFMAPGGQWKGVAMDVHIYAMFSIQTVEQGYADHLKTYCTWLPQLQASDRNHWTVVGEWTTASTDCAAYLNGRGRGARWDNTINPSPTNLTGSCAGKSGPASSYSQDYKTYLAQSFETQSWVYETGGSGWIYWTWKSEGASDWSFQDGVTYGWIPQPLDAKPHGQPCQNALPATTSAVTGAAISKHLPHNLLMTLLMILVLLG